MIALRCPNCHVKMAVSDQRANKPVLCPRCEMKFAVAQPIAEPSAAPAAAQTTLSQSASVQPASPVQPAEPVVNVRPQVTTPRTRRRARKKSTLATTISLCVHLLIFTTTVCGAYYLIWHVGILNGLQQKPEAQVAQPETPRRSTPAPNNYKRPEPRPHSIAPQRSEPQQVAPVLPVVANPLEGLPKHLNLPPTEDTSVTVLIPKATNLELSFVAYDPDLEYRDEMLIWNGDDNPVLCAGLTMKDNVVLFRWVTNGPEEARTAIINSVIELTSNGEVHPLALRQPVIVEPFQFDLKNSVQFVKCECEYSPNPYDIKVQIVPDPSLPIREKVGCSLDRMSQKDIATLWYSTSDSAATRLEWDRKGNLAALQFNTRYKLPSGDEEPMSIGQGNRKRKELGKLLQRAENASSAINGLKSDRTSLSNDLARARNLPTWRFLNGVKVRDTVAVADKARLINNLEGQLAATQNSIHLAERLISQKPAMSREMQELERVAELAHILHEAKAFSYCFYHEVGGHRVDLVRSE